MINSRTKMEGIIIGLTCSSNTKNIFTKKAYIKAIQFAGGIPVLLPDSEDENVISHYIENVDGVLLTGGGDVHPELYGQTEAEKSKAINLSRDQFECSLIRQFRKTRKPLLAICRGIQVMNIALGGNIYQDMDKKAKINHWQKESMHMPSHTISIEKNTLLHKTLNVDYLKVNSRHHQALRELSRSVVASAVATDGIVEAIEVREHPFLVGVQFHPEYMYDKDPIKNLFQSFINACIS